MTDYVIMVMVALIAASPGLMALLNQRRKNTADVATTYEAMSTKQAGEIGALREEIRVLQEKLDDQKQLIRELREEVRKLQDKLSEQNRLIVELRESIENKVTKS